MNNPKITLAEAQAAKPAPLFIRELRDKIRSGDKTQTRRPVKPQPDGTPDSLLNAIVGGPIRVGSILYLREPIQSRGYLGDPFATYSDDDRHVRCLLDGPFGTFKVADPLADDGLDWHWKAKHLSDSQFPKQAARTFIRVHTVKAERLLDISREDAQADGFHNEFHFNACWRDCYPDDGPFGLPANPWVYAYGFELVEVAR